MDARDFLHDEVLPRSRDGMFVYLDPPYYKKGPQLYLNASSHEDHERLASYLRRIRRFSWVASYDNVPEIRRMYEGMCGRSFDLTYTARDRSIGKEILIHRPELDVPTKLSNWISGRRIST
jgi:DNA adenine methylase